MLANVILLRHRLNALVDVAAYSPQVLIRYIPRNGYHFLPVVHLHNVKAAGVHRLFLKVGVPRLRQFWIFLVDNLGGDVEVFHVAPCGPLLTHRHSQVYRLWRYHAVRLDNGGDVGQIIEETEIFPILDKSDVLWQVFLPAYFVHVQQFGIERAGHWLGFCISLVCVAILAAVNRFIDAV